MQLCRGFERAKSNIRNAFVVRLFNGQLRMYFSEYAASIIGSKIVSALSKDGINWRREDRARLSAGESYDTHGVFCPSITPMSGGIRIYYGGYWGRHWLKWFTWLRHRRVDKF